MLRHLSNTVRLTDFVNIVTFNEDIQGKLAAQVLINETPIREQLESFCRKGLSLWCASWPRFPINLCWFDRENVRLNTPGYFGLRRELV